jgi:D-glycero-D-manno-heptose 1,7-bisphosphate phosphatase
MTKILFLDLDGTVRQSKSGATFINDPCDQELIPGVERAIACYSGYHIVGITNQGGVSSGHKTLKNCLLEQWQTLELLPQMNAIYFCPDMAGACCYWVNKDSCDRLENIMSINYRKPNPGILYQAIYHLHGWIPTSALKEFLFVGDRAEDEQCAKNANIPFMWANDWRKLKRMTEREYFAAIALQGLIIISGGEGDRVR